MLVRIYKIILYHDDAVLAYEKANLKAKNNLISRFNKAGKYELVKVDAGYCAFREDDGFSFDRPKKHKNKKGSEEKKNEIRLSPVYIPKINLYTIRDMGTKEVEIADGD